MGRVVRDVRLTSRRASTSRPGARKFAEGNAARALEPEDPADTAHLAPSSWFRRVALRMGPVVLALALLVLWIWHLDAERRAIRGLPQDRRRAVYDDTLQAFESMCTPPREGLSLHCRQQAGFLLKFEECDAHCRSIVVPLLRWRS